MEDKIYKKFNENNNFYETLDLNENASILEIKKNYKTLAKKFHPDKNRNIKDKLQIVEIS